MACSLYYIVINPQEFWGISENLPVSSQPSHDTWLTEWETHLMDSSLALQVQESACLVYTLLIPTTWIDLFANYPDQWLIQFFLRGITEGFQVGYNDHMLEGLKSSRKNLEGAKQYPEVVDEYLDKKSVLSRVAGSFNKA